MAQPHTDRHDGGSLRRRCSRWLAAASLLVATALPAGAHTGLLISAPFNGAILESAPAEISLTFRHPAALLALVLDAGDEAHPPLSLVETGADPVDSVAARRVMMRTTVVPLPPLGPGRYTLHWRAVAEDGHTVDGSIEFTVLPINR